MKLICVIQRYGSGIVGGAELHCRLVAEQLVTEHNVEIVTTCAADYLTWKNVYLPGTEIVNGIKVIRFPTDHQRPSNFDVIAHNVLYGHSTVDEQHEYLDAHGPVCPKMITYLQSRTDVDCFILFSYRYWTTWHALVVVGNRSILIPTAEHDRTLYLDIHAEAFRRPAAIAYNSVEERRLINQISNNGSIPGVTVGVGLTDIEPCSNSEIKNLDLPNHFFLYIGRIEESKGCNRLLADYMAYHQQTSNPAALVFIGKNEIVIPDHPGIFYLGVLPENIKLGVLRASLGLIMPSRYESLSMVLLEAWKMEKPVLCNSHCEVLRGQCKRSAGGLYYRNTDEFIETLSLLVSREDIRQHLARNGHEYYLTHYTWPVILSKYNDLLRFQGDKS